jgi:hypothetical protein
MSLRSLVRSDPDSAIAIIDLLLDSAVKASASAKRQKKWRQKHQGQPPKLSPVDVTSNATRDITQDVTIARNGSRAPSLSEISLSSPELSRSESESLLSTGRGAAAVVTLKDALPDELREAAKMQGVRDIDGAWVAFTGHHNGTPVGAIAGGVAGAWQKWCRRESNAERESRERASIVRKAPFANGNEPPANHPSFQKFK